MRAKDIMTEGVICLDVKESVFDAAELLLGAGISAAPIVNDKGTVVGIVSEADLIRRAEIGTAPKKSWLSRGATGRTTRSRSCGRRSGRRSPAVPTKSNIRQY